ESTPSWTAQELLDQVQRGRAPWILDVRSPAEFEEIHLREAFNIPLNHLEPREAEIPRDREVVVHCAGGYRST
ncbi:MAG: MBL fold metallo-hydrolase, partial [Nitrospinaceae bacterium]|nr:rhodanese-like domain-containing protein [Nitrospinaceae bacterium]NIR53984.1 rhodanese-like domain-containing protein [Nitrospinaceae bacterium]NIS84403.1 rhodanese-like domain-containing protein [Nitrospinaceae bacterium]NIT81194.1 rhodanese-like domain-containing protein [Nitrospinaceae bacterium]NIU43483.1 rhodanese-like domain-containing protein [Nitrospinaceae bacterium]